MNPRSNNSFFGKIRTLGIAAPASACDPEKLQRGISLLNQHGVKTVTGKHLFRKGSFSYLSADDSFRAEDFNDLAGNESVDAILCVRGGYGTPRILHEIDFDLLRRRNLPVIGFSDITALHLAMCAENAGICIASQMAARLPESFQCRTTRNGMKRVYARCAGTPGEYRKLGRKLTVWNSGERVSGGVIPLNLTLASALCGTAYLPAMTGRVIVLEEIGEPVRKIDRMLWQLQESGFFNGSAGVVFAQFSDCGKTAERNRLFADFASRVNCPVFSGLEYGHDLPSVSFLFDEPCRIENGIISVQW